MTVFRLIAAKTPILKDSNGNVPPNSIASLEKVKIGGFDQYILIRGYDISNPLLLFLHGGPGSPEMPVAYCTQKKLEQYFIIVHWDQRKAGKSYSKKIPNETLNIEQYISDTHELIQILKERFKKDKIYLIGHSWGSLLGTLVVHRYPELFHAYVGMGQVVNMKEGEKISYQYTLDAAKKAGNKKVISKLEKLKPPYGGNINDLRFQRKWCSRYGGSIYGKKSQWSVVKLMFMSPEYSFRDIIKTIKGMLNTLHCMWEQMADINFFEQVPELKIPVYFFEGRHDYQVPFEVVEKYIEKLKAPKKKIIWFEKSGHMPNIQETEKYEQVLISEVLIRT